MGNTVLKLYSLVCSLCQVTLWGYKRKKTMRNGILCSLHFSWNFWSVKTLIDYLALKTHSDSLCQFLKELQINPSEGFTHYTQKTHAYVDARILLSSFVFVHHYCLGILPFSSTVWESDGGFTESNLCVFFSSTSSFAHCFQSERLCMALENSCSLGSWSSSTITGYLDTRSWRFKFAVILTE